MQKRLHQGYFFTPFLKPLTKLSASFVLPVFVITSFVSSPSAFSAGSLPELPLNAAPAMVRELPAAQGHVTGWQWNANSKNPFVIHIQDAHANASAQESIRQILHWIDAQRREQGLGLAVAIEGASGKIHPEYFDLVPGYLSAGKAAVRKLAEQGELSGADLFAWDLYVDSKVSTSSASKPAAVYGAETPELYADNLESFRRLLYEQAEIENLLVPVRAALEREASRVLPAALRAFLKERRLRKLGDYGSGAETPQWEAWLPYLAETAKEVLSIDLKNRFEQIRFPQLTRMLALQQLNAVNPENEPQKALQQKEKLLKKLKKAALTPEARAQLRELASLEKSLNPRAAVEAVTALAAQYRISLTEYPLFWKQAAQIILSSEMDAETLALEMEQVEQAVTDRLAGTPAEKEIVKTYGQLALLEELLKLEMPRKHFDALKTQASMVRVLSRQAYLAKSLSEKLETFEKAARHFYEGALERDQVLVSQALKKQSADNVVVLISGGFHTGGIETLLRSSNSNFAVIRPAMTTSDHGKAYHRVLKEENADLSAYFDEPVLNKQEALFLKSYLETVIPVLAEKTSLAEDAIAEKTSTAMNAHPVLKNSLLSAAAQVNDSAQLILTPRTASNTENSSKLIQAVAASDVMQTPKRFARSWQTLRKPMPLPARSSWAIGLKELGVKKSRSEVRVKGDRAREKAEKRELERLQEAFGDDPNPDELLPEIDDDLSLDDVAYIFKGFPTDQVYKNLAKHGFFLTKSGFWANGDFIWRKGKPGFLAKAYDPEQALKKRSEVRSAGGLNKTVSAVLLAGALQLGYSNFQSISAQDGSPYDLQSPVNPLNPASPISPFHPMHQEDETGEKTPEDIKAAKEFDQTLRVIVPLVVAGMGVWLSGRAAYDYFKNSREEEKKRSEVRSSHSDLFEDLQILYSLKSGISEADLLQGRMLNIAVDTGMRDRPESENLVSTLRAKGVDMVGLDPQLPNDPSRGYYKGVVQEIPFPDGHFKSVVSFGLWDPGYLRLILPNREQDIEAFYDQGLAEIDRVLEPGGLFYTSAYSNPEDPYVQYFVSVLAKRGFSIAYVTEGTYGSFVFRKEAAKSEVRVIPQEAAVVALGAAALAGVGVWAVRALQRQHKKNNVIGLLREVVQSRGENLVGLLIAPDSLNPGKYKYMRMEQKGDALFLDAAHMDEAFELHAKLERLPFISEGDLMPMVIDSRGPLQSDPFHDLDFAVAMSFLTDAELDGFVQEHGEDPTEARYANWTIVTRDAETDERLTSLLIESVDTARRKFRAQSEVRNLVVSDAAELETLRPAERPGDLRLSSSPVLNALASLPLPKSDEILPRKVVLVYGGLGAVVPRFYMPFLEDFAKKFNVEYRAVDLLPPEQAERIIRERGLPYSAYIHKDSYTVDPADKPAGVLILTRPNSHFDIMQWAVSHGMMTFVEKPVVTPQDVPALIPLYEEHAEKVFGIDFFLDNPSALDAVEMLSADKLGKIQSIRGRMMESNGVEPGREWLLNPEISGGGLMMDMMPHLIALGELLLERYGLSFADLQINPQELLLTRYEGAPEGTETYGQFAGMIKDVRVDLGAGKGAHTNSYFMIVEGEKGTLEINLGTDSTPPFLEFRSKTAGEPPVRKEYSKEKPDIGYQGTILKMLDMVQERGNVEQAERDFRLKALALSVQILSFAQNLSGGEYYSHVLGTDPEQAERKPAAVPQPVDQLAQALEAFHSWELFSLGLHQYFESHPISIPVYDRRYWTDLEPEFREEFFAGRSTPLNIWEFTQLVRYGQANQSRYLTLYRLLKNDPFNQAVRTTALTDIPWERYFRSAADLADAKDLLSDEASYTIYKTLEANRLFRAKMDELAQSSRVRVIRNAVYVGDDLAGFLLREEGSSRRVTLHPADNLVDSPRMLIPALNAAAEESGWQIVEEVRPEPQEVLPYQPEWGEYDFTGTGIARQIGMVKPADASVPDGKDYAVLFRLMDDSAEEWDSLNGKSLHYDIYVQGMEGLENLRDLMDDRNYKLHLTVQFDQDGLVSGWGSIGISGRRERALPWLKAFLEEQLTARLGKSFQVTPKYQEADHLTTRAVSSRLQRSEVRAESEPAARGRRISTTKVLWLSTAAILLLGATAVIYSRVAKRENLPNAQQLENSRNRVQGLRALKPGAEALEKTTGIKAPAAMRENAEFEERTYQLGLKDKQFVIDKAGSEFGLDMERMKEIKQTERLSDPKLVGQYSVKYTLSFEGGLEVRFTLTSVGIHKKVFLEKGQEETVRLLQAPKRSEVRLLDAGDMDRVSLAGPVEIGFTMARVRSEVRSFEEGEELVARAESFLAEKKFKEAADAFREAVTHLTPVAETGAVPFQKRMAARMLQAIRHSLETLDAIDPSLPAAVLAGFGYTVLTDESQFDFLEAALNQMGITGIRAQSAALAQAERLAEILENRAPLTNDDNPDLKIINMLGLRDAQPATLYQEKPIHVWRTDLSGLAAQPLTLAAPQPVVNAAAVITAPAASLPAPAAPAPSAAEPAERLQQADAAPVSDLDAPAAEADAPADAVSTSLQARTVFSSGVSVLQIPTAQEIYDARYGSRPAGSTQLSLDIFQTMWASYGRLVRANEAITAGALNEVNAQPRRMRFREGLENIKISLAEDSVSTFTEDIFVRMLRYATDAETRDSAVLPPDQDDQLAADLFEAYALTIKGGRSPQSKMQDQFKETILAYRKLMQWSDSRGIAAVKTVDLQIEWKMIASGEAHRRRRKFHKALGALGLTDEDFIQRLWRSRGETAAAAPASSAAQPTAAKPVLTPAKRWELLRDIVTEMQRQRQGSAGSSLGRTIPTIQVLGQPVPLNDLAEEFRAWFAERDRVMAAQGGIVKGAFTLNRAQFLEILLTHRDFHQVSETLEVPLEYLGPALARAAGLSEQHGKRVWQVLSTAFKYVKGWRRIDFVQDLIEGKPSIYDTPDYNVLGERPARVEASRHADAGAEAAAEVPEAPVAAAVTPFFPPQEFETRPIIDQADAAWQVQHGAQSGGISPVNDAEKKLSSAAVLAAVWLRQHAEKDPGGLREHFDLLNPATLLSIFAYYRLAYRETRLGITPRAMAITRGLALAHPEHHLPSVTNATLEVRNLLAQALGGAITGLENSADPFAHLTSYKAGETQQPSYIQQEGGPHLLGAYFPKAAFEAWEESSAIKEQVSQILSIYVQALRAQEYPPSRAEVEKLLNISGGELTERLEFVNTFLQGAGFQPLFLLPSETWTPLFSNIVEGIRLLAEQDKQIALHEQPKLTAPLFLRLQKTVVFNSNPDLAAINRELAGNETLWQQVGEWLRMRYPDHSILPLITELRRVAIAEKAAHEPVPVPAAPASAVAVPVAAPVAAKPAAAVVTPTPAPAKVPAGPSLSDLRNLDGGLLSNEGTIFRGTYFRILRETTLPPTREELLLAFENNADRFSQGEENLNAALKTRGLAPVVVLSAKPPVLVNRIAKLLIQAAQEAMPTDAVVFTNLLPKFTSAAANFSEADVLSALGTENDAVWNQLLTWASSLGPKHGPSFIQLTNALREEAAEYALLHVPVVVPAAPALPAGPSVPDAAVVSAPSDQPVPPEAAPVPDGLIHLPEFDVLTAKALRVNDFGHFSIQVKLKQRINLQLFWKLFQRVRSEAELPGDIKTIERVTRGKVLKRDNGGRGKFDFSVVMEAGEVLTVNSFSRSEVRGLVDIAVGPEGGFAYSEQLKVRVTSVREGNAHVIFEYTGKTPLSKEELQFHNAEIGSVLSDEFGHSFTVTEMKDRKSLTLEFGPTPEIIDKMIVLLADYLKEPKKEESLRALTAAFMAYRPNEEAIVGLVDGLKDKFPAIQALIPLEPALLESAESMAALETLENYLAAAILLKDYFLGPTGPTVLAKLKTIETVYQSNKGLLNAIQYVSQRFEAQEDWAVGLFTSEAYPLDYYMVGTGKGRKRLLKESLETIAIKQTVTLISLLAKRDALPEKVPMIIVFGSPDPEPALEAARLYKAGKADKILVSGRYGFNVTDNSGTKPEAEVYRELLLQQGVPAEAILVEDQSRHMGQNAEFSFKLLSGLEEVPEKAIFIHSFFFTARGLHTAQQHFTATQFYAHAANVPKWDDVKGDRRLELLEKLKTEVSRIEEFNPTLPEIEKLRAINFEFIQRSLPVRSEVRRGLEGSEAYVDQLRTQSAAAGDTHFFSRGQRTVAQRSAGFYAAPGVIAREQGMSWQEAALAVFRVIAEEEGLVLDETQVLPLLQAARDALGEFAPLLDSTGESFRLADVVSAEQLNQGELVYALAVHVLARPGDQIRLYTTGPDSQASLKAAAAKLESILKKAGAPEGYAASRVIFINASSWTNVAKLGREIRRDLGGKQSGLRGALLSARFEFLNAVLGSGIFGLQRQAKNANAARLISPAMLADSLDEHTVHQIEAWLSSKGMDQRLSQRFAAMIAAVRLLSEAA